ncbi:hypothetical protein SAMN02746065_14510 [Desulfocicer vacuolatum DSM 3385]|uniref:Uncharacterized protein n=1 Tax=Desulfocicer vacuolatum DSM 3385 TaxID=1121400 RepID=A0A1W2ETT1_9BACT|nr:hypothetical protein [Desulfocicer vacuolatum]SMD13061.1 hypothetical protein SAMN02746065_14510 [Desulfocicer vacuolatum DSM 3385]
MTISDEQINNILRKIEEKIVLKIDEEVDEAYLPTDEQMEKGYQAALDYIDTHEPSLLEQLKTILRWAGKSASQGFMLPARLSDQLATFRQSLIDLESRQLGLGPALRSSEKSEEREHEENKAAVNELLNYLEQHNFTWHSAGVAIPREKRLIIGLQQLGVTDYETDNVKVPEIKAVSQLEVGKIKLVEAVKAPSWIRVRIDAVKPFPPIDEIGIRVSQDPSSENKLKLTLEKV